MVTLTKTRQFSRTRDAWNKLTTSHQYIDAGKLQWDDDRNGVQNPKFRSQIRYHANATTDFNGSRYVVHGSTSGIALTRFTDSANPAQGETTIKMIGDLVDIEDVPMIGVYTDNGVRSAVINRALARFYNNASDAIRSFEGGVFLGELRESLALIKRPAKSIRNLVNIYHKDAIRRTRRFYRTGRRIDPARVKDANKVVADTWLEHSFGIQPLLNDVRKGAEALARLALDPNDYRRVRGYQEQFVDATIFGAPGASYTKTLDTWITYRFNRRQKDGYQCRYIGEVKCTVDNPYLMSKEVLGFNTWNFVPTIWELIPYSFLVDYFTNIGDVINAWSFPQSRITWYCRTVRSRAERTVTGAMVPAGSVGSVKVIASYGTSLHVVAIRSTIQRTGSSLGLGFPSFTFEIPGSSTKWLNIAALAFMRTP
jgi:hypothetical protein